MSDKGLDLKESSVHGQTAGVMTGVSGQHTFSFFSPVPLSRNFCPRLVSLEPGPVFSTVRLSMWVVVISAAVA